MKPMEALALVRGYVDEELLARSEYHAQSQMKNGKGNGKHPNALTPKIRCAIYTRKPRKTTRKEGVPTPSK